MTNEQEWKDLPDLQWVATAQAEGWEIEVSPPETDWNAWEGNVWWSVCDYRARPRQPKMKTIRFECFIIDGELSWREEGRSVLRDWIRVPSEDKTVEVPA